MSNHELDGEDIFANSFQFKDFVPKYEHEILRDFLYKFAHNYDEAKNYLQILKQVNGIENANREVLLSRIHGMALQCFALSIRRLTDNIGNRSSQKLIKRSFKEELKAAEVKKIKKVYSHYSSYLNRTVAHQDRYGIIDTLGCFPCTDIIDKDMDYLRVFYTRFVKEICTTYITLDSPPDDYDEYLQKLRKDFTK